MAIARGRSNNFGVRATSTDFALLFDPVTGDQTRIKQENLTSGSFRDVFNRYEYGEYILIPNVDFVGYVEMWGAGGGCHSHANSDTGNTGGGGGYARSTIRFKKDIPYCIVVGQGGSHVNNTPEGASLFYNSRFWQATIGGGGQGHASGGSGGGLSGIFYNSFGSIDYSPAGGNSRAASQQASVLQTRRSTTYPQQANALLIAGGGGGGGHTGAANHGQAGGGGGTTSNPAHNTTGASQTNGGNGGYGGLAGIAMLGGQAGTGSSHTGGGGGGWFGGGGGGHTTGHHNGGSGGSGHAIDLYSSGPNSHLLQFVSGSYLETSPSVYVGSNASTANTNRPAQDSNARRFATAGRGGGRLGSSPAPLYNATYNIGGDGQVIISLQQGWS